MLMYLEYTNKISILSLVDEKNNISYDDKKSRLEDFYIARLPEIKYRTQWAIQINCKVLSKHESTIKIQGNAYMNQPESKIKINHILIKQINRSGAKK